MGQSSSARFVPGQLLALTDKLRDSVQGHFTIGNTFHPSIRRDVTGSHHIRAVLNLGGPKVSHNIGTCTLTFEYLPPWDQAAWALLFDHNNHCVCMNCDRDHFQNPPEKVVLDLRALKSTIAQNITSLKMSDRRCLNRKT